MNRPKHKITDRRAGYQRQAQEPVVITCECGARVIEHRTGLAHIGPCKASQSTTEET